MCFRFPVLTPTGQKREVCPCPECSAQMQRRDCVPSPQGFLRWGPQQMGTAETGDFHPPPNSPCTHPPQHPDLPLPLPQSSSSTLGSIPEGQLQIASPNQVHLPPFYLSSAQPGFPLGVANSDCSPRLAELVGPCVRLSQQATEGEVFWNFGLFDGGSLPHK